MDFLGKMKMMIRSVSGQMDHGMEDYLVAETRKVNGHQLGLYAIFAGQQVAEYLQAHLFDKILRYYI
ncbi:putative PPM-type phosphatase domain, protein phosphatase 2C family [Rosa chinensis]|uniref:Putative PPM-type phosphatase domain, protein phosphatase 2C family n=1 Tax=Rosa chinensis TaxID=74649 RepID=A0A2P6Q6G6_ROSCH|nr:putative PPM-type phosphatase domain, protein phosphatase 2C family [Rosa chinensis]